ncbi:MAG: c-type cytochrome [Proteobacteria bacterium]|nr:c-type cytochrome [Pseudomonadota bacterium]
MMMSGALSILLNTLCVTQALADDNYRNEPIFPIPLKAELDENKVALGETLFFDTRLSKDNRFSCASCHQLDAGGVDGIALGPSLSEDQHVINTPTVFNAVYNFRQNWDGSVKTLGEQVEMVINNPHEFGTNWNTILPKLNKDIELNNRFYAVYLDGMSRNNVIDAIVEFEKSLTTPNSRFDRYLRNEENSLSKEELKGYRMFKELGCISCHQGINVGGNLYQKFGVFYNYLAERGNINEADYGRMNVTGRQMDAFVFKVPSLRNIMLTAPYLHDGSAENIEQAISIMGRTQLGRTLTDREVFYIKAFLITLTGEYKDKPLNGHRENAS